MVVALTVVISGVLGGCAAAPAHSLRVMAYNIRHGEGMDGLVDLERIARVIVEADPDLVALQEIDNRTGRTGGVDQAVRLGALTGMHSGFATFMNFGGGEYGLAILSKSPIDEIMRLPLPPGKHEPRAALAVRTTPRGWASPVVFVSLHFDWLQEDTERFAQAQSLLGQLVVEDGLVILAGDFNDTPESRTMQLVFESFANAEKAEGDRLTFSSTAPDREIDFVVSRPAGALVGASRVIDEPMASDHRPVVADFIYRAGSPW